MLKARRRAAQAVEGGKAARLPDGPTAETRPWGRDPINLKATSSAWSSLALVLLRNEPVKHEAPVRLATWISFLSVLGSGVAETQEVRSLERQAGPERAASGELVLVELEGFVLEPGGSPAEGAVVVSSAGGKAFTDRDGAYRLGVRVPSGTTSVQVTSVSGRGLVASTHAALSAASQLAPVGPLVLALGNSCSPSWLPTFRGTGTSDYVAALAMYDDGEGPALYAAGNFTFAGGRAANRIAKWDGSSWTPLGSGLDGDVRALAVHDDGSGPALFVGGTFTTAGGALAKRIAKWNGTSWSALGSGVVTRDGVVNDLAVYDDGGGPALYAAGFFSVVGGVSANRIARWNGTSWSALGAGVSSGSGGSVTSLVVHDDGSGPALFVGGFFTSAGGVAASNIARWNGTSWSALGAGVNSTVYALAVYEVGGGAALYAGGTFTSSGPATVNRIARWNGSNWSAVGRGFDGTVRALRAFDDGSGAKLWAGGSFGYSGTYFDGTLVNHIAVWNGTSWQAAGSGMDGGGTFPEVKSLCAFDDGDGPALFAGGLFAVANGVDVNNIAKREGSTGASLAKGLSARVEALAVFDDGTGPGLYAGGDFVTASGVTLNRIGKWDGWSWTPLGSGMDGTVRALVVHDDGSGPALFAGGSFVHAGGKTVNYIAKWNGSSWSALDLGVSQGTVSALAVHDDGGGPALYAGGTFLLAGGAFGTVWANRIAKWDGHIWHGLGTGVNTQGGVVNALISHNDGSGQKLYAGGQFSSVGWVAADSIARWNGSSWAPVGSGLDGPVEAFVVHNGALVASGDFLQSGFVWLYGGIGKWNGSSWSALAYGPPSGGLEGNTKFALAVHDDGTGPMLHAGTFRWNGTSWSRLGNGAQGPVLALATYDDGSGPALFAGGQIGSFVDSGDSFLGVWGCDPLPPVIHAPPVLVIDRPVDGPGETVTLSVEVIDNHDPAPEVWFDPPSGSRFPPGTTMVTCWANDAHGNGAMTEFPVTVQRKARPGERL